MIDYDKIALEYAHHRRVHPGVLKRLFEASGITSASKVLEVGCGTGNYILALESLARCLCWGIDPSQQMLSKARERSRRIDFRIGTAEKLEFPQDFFDLVFSVDVIHHVKDRVHYLREAHRILKKSGQICTTTDSEWIIRHRQPLAVYFPETVEADLARYPSIAELREAMKLVGFRDIRENMEEFPYQLTDAQPYRERAFSCLHLIPEEAFRRGIDRMEQELRLGPIQCVSRYLLLWGRRTPS